MMKKAQAASRINQIQNGEHRGNNTAHNFLLLHIVDNDEYVVTSLDP